MGYLKRCTKIVYGPAENFTIDGNPSLISFGVINAVLALPTAAANALVIVAILTTSSLRTPSYLLLTSLAFSDLAVGLFGQPLLSSLIFNFLNGEVQTVCYVLAFKYVISSWASWASIFTITAISVDRYLAIRLKMRYRSVVTVRRIRFIVGLIWMLSLGAMLAPLRVKFVTKITKFCAALQGMCLLLILFSYTMSFRALKIHCAQIQPQGNQQQPNSTTQSNAIDVLKYRKLLKTMILIVTLIFTCYLPLVAVFVIVTLITKSYKAKEFDEKLLLILGYPILSGLITIMNISSTLNPLIYMTRMKELREACIQVMRRLCPS